MAGTLPRSWAQRRVVPALVVLGAVATLAVLSWAGGWFEGGAAGGAGSTVAITAWALAPFLGMGAVVAVGARRLTRGLPAVAVGVVALTGVTAWALSDFTTSESSTAALLFIFLPVYQWVVVLVTAGLAVVWHRVRRRRTPARSGTPPAVT